MEVPVPKLVNNWSIFLFTVFKGPFRLSLPRSIRCDHVWFWYVSLSYVPCCYEM